LTLTFDPHQLTFDQAYPTGSGRIIGISILPYNNEAVYVSATPIAIETYPQQLSHPNLQVCKSIATSFYIHTNGSPTPCGHCAISKSKNTKITKTTSQYATAKL
jgi:hypothetical protein